MFGPDESCGPDPLDTAKTPRSHYDFIGDNGDVLVIWREYGEQFEGGNRTHVAGQGIFENIGNAKKIGRAIERLLGL